MRVGFASLTELRFAIERTTATSIFGGVLTALGPVCLASIPLLLRFPLGRPRAMSFRSGVLQRFPHVIADVFQSTQTLKTQVMREAAGRVRLENVVHETGDFHVQSFAAVRQQT